MDSQKIVVFDDLVCESKQNSIINYFINVASFTLLRPSTRCLRSYGIPAAISVSSGFYQGKTSGLQTFDRATNKRYSFLYYDKPRKVFKKNFDEDI